MKRALIALVLLIVAAPLTLFLLSSGTRLSVDPPVKVIGFDTAVRVHAINPHGIRRLTATIEQDAKSYPAVVVTQTPVRRVSFVRRHDPPRDVIVNLGKKTAPALHDGKAKVVIEAQSNDLRGETDKLSYDVDVIIAPPRLAVDGAQHYINVGGSELVTFAASGYWTDAGVKVDRYTFRSFPAPGGGSERLSLFAYPWDLPATAQPFVYATNPAGGMARGSFWFKIFPKKFRSRAIEITDPFLERVVNQIDPQGSGDLLERFLKINRDMRLRNNQTLADLRLQSEPKFLFSGSFLPLVNSAVESQFADRRSYIYKGKKVDEQVHLGFDLAKLMHSPVPASNDGKVLWAADLGIYGNCIVIDHGYGLQSIYGHMSEFKVQKGDTVKRGQQIGVTGATGLAGGDHLHFSMQVDGIQVNPIEWWDEHWIKDRIFSKVK